MRLATLAFAFPIALALAGITAAFVPSIAPAGGGEDAFSVVQHIFDMADKKKRLNQRGFGLDK